MKKISTSFIIGLLGFGLLPAQKMQRKLNSKRKTVD